MQDIGLVLYSLEKNIINSNNNCHIIIPASGIGTRFDANIPKQYFTLANGASILDIIIEKLLASNIFLNFIIVINANDNYFINSKFYQHPQITTIIGDKERFLSVKKGIDYLSTIIDKNDFIAVHDAVRPLVDIDDINNLLNVIKNHEVGGLLAIKAENTIKFKNNKTITTLDRNKIYQAQTPQIYRANILITAINNIVNNNLSVTDEAQAVELLGFNSVIVAGKKNNIKITTKDDLKLANFYLNL